MQWISALQLEEWARRTTARADLPKIVGDLIRATCPDITSFRFPSGEKGQARGFDGHLETDDAALNIPKGSSYWEFGTKQNYKLKASEEIERVSKLFSDSDRIEKYFIFVSPWTWDSSDPNNKIEDWEARNAEKFGWKAVSYIDGLKLEAWLESCPAVSAWHARNTMQISPQNGARSIDEFWEQFRNYFKPPLTEEVLLCERDEQKEKLLNILLGGPDRISFSADLPDEVIAFAVAAIRKANSKIRLFLDSRTLIVDSMDAGRMLINQPNIIYLLRGDSADAPGQFATRGPTLVPIGRYQRSSTTQALNRPSGQMLGMALQSMGIGEARALTLARGCGRSLTVLMRQIPGGSCQPPEWMPHRNILLPSILLGGWDADNELDIEVVQSVAEIDIYRKYESGLRAFLVNSDPPLEREGAVWKVRAPIDAFLHIGELIGPEHLDVLRKAMVSVFGRVEPERDPKDIVRISDPPSTHSEWLRDGLATTLLLIAVWQKEARLSLKEGEGQRFANELVESLPGLKTNHRLLASLRNELPLLAEAAPVPLLSALEHMLEGDGAAIRPLLVEVEGFLSPVSYHVGLLWALETLAWDPTYFDRAVKILARLSMIDPGGRISNRPFNSLREIFLLWNPNTNATFPQRIAAIDEICSNWPEIGWRLICALLPTHHGSSTPTHRPRLREAGASDRAPVTYRELWDNQSAIVRRAVQLAGRAPSRWIELLPSLSHLSPDERALVVRALASTLDDLDEVERLPLWKKLRDEVRRHERFSAAPWALPADQLEPLQVMMERHAPLDPIPNAVWRFDNWMEDAYKDADGAKQRRVATLTQISEAMGLDGILRLGLETKAAFQVVDAWGELKPSRQQIEDLLVAAINVSPTSAFPPSLFRFHREIVSEAAAMAWLSMAMPAYNWSPKTAAHLLSNWPFKLSTWHFVRRLGIEVDKWYWTTIGPVGSTESKHELIRAILKILRYGKAIDALRSIVHGLQNVPTRLVFRILDKVLIQLNSDDAGTYTSLNWELESVFRELDNRSDASEGELTMREFAYLPALEHGQRPLRLHKLMAQEPDLYHGLLCEVFVGEDAEEPKREPSESERNKARISYSLLSKFSTVPGETDGDIDPTALLNWIDRLRILAKNSGRVAVADNYIGRTLAYAPSDPDGGWPHRVIRDQIERLKSDEVERGIRLQRFNMRGAHWKSPFGGGAEERGFAKQNREYAEKASAWPRTSALLRAIADSWDAHAEQEDLWANQRKLRS